MRNGGIMTRLDATNCREYLLLKLAICGELACTGIGDNAPYSKSYVLKEIAKMRNENIIHDHRYKDRKRYYRLKDPAGTEALSRCHPDALSHLDVMVGEQGKRYKGSQDHRIKMRRMYDICTFYNDMGIAVDRMKIVRDSVGFGTPLARDMSRSNDSVFTAEGELKKMQDILGMISPDEMVFLSRRLIRKLSDKYSFKGRYEMFRAVGILVHQKQLYEIYYFMSAEERWTADTERALVNATTLHAEQNLSAFAAGKDRMLQSKAIIYLPDVQSVEMIVPKKERGNAQRIREKKKENESSAEPVEVIDPLDVYNIAYAVPLSENAEDITRMLLIDGWRNKVCDAIPVKVRASNNELEFGWMDEQRTEAVYNLLCCNVGYMRQIAPRINSSNVKSKVIIHDWQEELVRMLYGENVITIDVDAKMFKALLCHAKNA